MAKPQAARWSRMLRDGDPSLHVYLMGIGGAGLSALACVLHEQGYRVSGSDMHASPVTTHLVRQGIPVILGQTEAHLAQLDPAQRPHVVVYSSAIPDSNREWRKAQALGLPMANRAAFLPALLAERKVVAVAGTHGKSTTTAMIVQMLRHAQRDPGFIIGSTHASLPSGHAGTEPLFIIEADEYAGMFLGLHPHLAVVTAMDWDHPDCYPTPAAMTRAYAQFLTQVADQGPIVYNRDDANLQAWAVVQDPGPRPLISFGRKDPADWQLQSLSPGQSAFRLCCTANGDCHVIDLPVPGLHNQYNAAAAWLAAQAVGLSPTQATAGLETYTALHRRFQIRGEFARITIVDDYAHHPRAVAATLQAARQQQRGGCLWAVFQPHTFSRTQALLPAFREAFAEADRVIIMQAYAAREQPHAGVGGDTLAAAIRHPHVTYCPTQDAALTCVTQDAAAGDLVLVMGAGDCWRLSDMLIAYYTEA